MTARSVLWAALLAALLPVAGCSSSDDTDDTTAAVPSAGAGDAAGAGDPTGAGDPATGGGPDAPPLAGRSEAAALAPLPDGAATGTAVIAYSGVGEVRAPFTGECSHDGDTTRLEGSADTAEIRLDVAPDGAALTLDDLGLSATSDLAAGRYDVAGDHLSLAAPLVSGGQTVGQVELEVDCGG